MILKRTKYEENELIEIEEGGIKYYPCNQLMSKFLLKSTIPFHAYDKYKPYTKKFQVDFGYNTGGLQECNCMSIDGWINYTKTVKFGKMNDEQKYQHNLFCNIINSKYKYIKDGNSEFYDEYILDCIKEYKTDNPDCEYLKCSLCEREYPISNEFFIVDDRNKSGYSTICKMCQGNYYPIMCKDLQVRKIYKNYGIDGYKLYKHDIVKFYNSYCHNKDFTLKVKSVDICKKLVKYYYNKGCISNDKLNTKFIKEYFNVEIYTKLNIINNDINEWCSENDCKIRPWLYPHYRLGIVQYTQANIIFNQYIKDKNIKIDNILTYDKYTQILKSAKLSQFNYNILKFIVQYYNYEYAGYKFKTPSSNFYKDKEMRNFDLKWFVEKDLKIPIEKIPLYVTRYSLNQKALPLYHIINKYYDSLFDWVNDCYPDKFNINDFEVNPYRARFDSLEEAQIHEVLNENIGNVIYNDRNSKTQINIDNMIPDWLIFTKSSCYLVEYFGLHSKNVETSHRLKRYKAKEETKIEKYNNLKGYKHIFIYPEDLKNDFQGLKHKLLKIT